MWALIRAIAWVVSAIAFLALGACRNERYCCTDPQKCGDIVPCSDPALSFCDNDGVFGCVRNSCIPATAAVDAGVTDGGVRCVGLKSRGTEDADDPE